MPSILFFVSTKITLPHVVAHSTWQPNPNTRQVYVSCQGVYFRVIHNKILCWQYIGVVRPRHISSKSRRFQKQRVASLVLLAWLSVIIFKVYLDESWVNANHRSHMQWIDEETGCGRKTKSGKGARWIILGKIQPKPIFEFCVTVYKKWRSNSTSFMLLSWQWTPNESG